MMGLARSAPCTTLFSLYFADFRGKRSAQTLKNGIGALYSRTDLSVLATELLFLRQVSPNCVLTRCPSLLSSSQALAFQDIQNVAESQCQRSRVWHGTRFGLWSVRYDFRCVRAVNIDNEAKVSLSWSCSILLIQLRNV